MKIIFFILAILISGPSSLNQKLNGMWQEKTISAGDGYLGRYIFSDSTFEYHVNSYDELNSIRTIGGYYSIQKNKIIFKIHYIDKFDENNMKIWKSFTATINDTWSIDFDSSKLIRMKLNPIIEESAVFLMLSKDCIEVDGKKYYHCTDYQGE